MAHRDEADADEELVALYLAGALPPAEAAAFVTRLASGSPDTLDLVRGAGEAVRELAADAPPADPPAEVRDRVLAGVARGHRPPPGVLVRRAGGGFTPTRVPGVARRLLHVDRSGGRFSCLLKLDPGAVLPAHPHAGPEECVVLEGELVVGGARLARGDYQRVEAGTDHPDQWTETGAVVYLAGPLALLTD